MRRFEIEVSDTPQGLLTVTTSAAQAAGRGASVSYTLSREAQVTVEIRNLAGRLVAAIDAQATQPAGRNVATWGGRTQAGTTVPAGRYLIRVIARSADGQEASAMATVTIAVRVVKTGPARVVSTAPR